jgi:hypothetical protein
MSSSQELKVLKYLVETLDDEQRMIHKSQRVAQWTSAAAWILLCLLFLAAFSARELGLWWALFTVLGCAAGVLVAIGSYSQQGIVQWRVLRPFLDAEAIRRAHKERNP